MYIDKNYLKSYLDISETTDDALIASLIQKAQKFIESYTRRVFESEAEVTHYFTVGEDTDGRDLLFDSDWCSISAVVTDADGDAHSLTENTDYIPMPRYETPYFGLRLLTSSDYVWEFTNDPEMGVKVTGHNAYSTTAPEDIKQATARMAAYYYHQKDAQVFETTALPAAGVITVPKGIPPDVMKVIEMYRRRI